MAVSASGDGQAMPGMMQQPGRMNARPPLPMGGNGQPEMGAAPPPPPLGAGGPTSPFNIGAMLQPQQSLQPETADGLLGDPSQGGGQGERTGPGQSMPMIMLQLMKMLGHISG